MTEHELDHSDRALLNVLQTSFPLVSHPFGEIGEAMGMPEATVLERLHRLHVNGVVREISAILDTRRLGYQSSLVAMSVPEDRVDRAAEVVNSHPGVSHNYHRQNEFNLWFTIALPPAASLHGTVGRLHDLAQSQRTMLLPAVRVFKIGVFLDMGGDRQQATGDRSKKGDRPRSDLQSPISSLPVSHSPIPPLSHSASSPGEELMAQVRALQEHLPLVSRPFREAARRLGQTEGQYLEGVRGLIERGYVRRFGAVLHHRRAGFLANAMGVWQVPAGSVLRVGTQMAAFPAISHCYERVTYPDWPYNLFTMVHARGSAECEAVLRRVADHVGIGNYVALYSDREYKKARVRLFTGEFSEWEKRWGT